MWRMKVEKKNTNFHLLHNYCISVLLLAPMELERAIVMLQAKVIPPSVIAKTF